MRRRGIPVALATDGPGSNNSQDMLETLKAACLLQKVANLDAMALPAGRRGLDGVPRRRGGVRPAGPDRFAGGRQERPTWRLSDLNTPFATPVRQAGLRAGLQCWRTARWTRAIVDGELLMRGKQVLCVDEEALLAEAWEACGRGCSSGRGLW